jgi:hypothetical protein
MCAVGRPSYICEWIFQKIFLFFDVPILENARFLSSVIETPKLGEIAVFIRDEFGRCT